MSTIVEIAELADVPVEGVVRVLTRRPVSTEVSERVQGVLDQLVGVRAQVVVERFALAAIPDLLPPKATPASGAPDQPQPPAKAAALQLEGSLKDAGVALVRSERHPVRSTDEDALLAQLGAYFQALADSVNELQREGAAHRQDRIADLAVLVDLISSSSEGVDRRLGRLEQMVARIEATRR